MGGRELDLQGNPKSNLSALLGFQYVVVVVEFNCTDMDIHGRK